MRKQTRTADRNSSNIASRRRRLALFAMIVVGSGMSSTTLTDVFAQNPSIVIRSALPPLPVSNVKPTSGVQSNPFFRPTAPIAESAVRLASGDVQSAIRLRPIGAPIDLNTIGEDPVTVRPSSITIEELPQASVQTNPLIGSAHHKNDGLVETSTADFASSHKQATAAKIKPITSSIPEFRPPAPQAVNVNVSEAQPEAQFVPRGQAAVSQPKSNTVEADIQLTADAREGREPIAESQPIYFSISDDDASDQKVTEQSPIIMAEEPTFDEAPIAESTETEVVAEMYQALDAEVQVENDANTKADNNAKVVVAEEPSFEPTLPTVSEEKTDIGYASNAMPKPVMADGPTAPIEIEGEKLKTAFSAEVAEDFDSTVDANSIENLASEDGAVDEPSIADAQELQPAPPAVYRDEPIVQAPVMQPEPSLIQRRYRPPVAVDSPPIAVTRDISSQENASPVFTVQSVEAEKLVLEELSQKPSEPILPEITGAKPSALYMTRTQVRSLTIGGHVRRVAVGDKNVCQAFAAGPNQLKLIGTGNGVTRLVVWADTTDSSPTRVRSFEIHVEDKAAPSGIEDKTAIINQSIRQAFPNSRVVVQQQRNSLVASGDCQSEEAAKDIIRMIRKTCLIPVRDEIKVR